MPQYYFDIETVPLDEYRNDAGASFDPFRAKIIIQYQKLDGAAGEQLMTLKELELYLIGLSMNSGLFKETLSFKRLLIFASEAG